ncbi:MAG TPA: glycosyltransferase [Candidatus Baltobacteraceae bacterium]|nr:glycosyltransferase [Candidatus Baltobacteraceae bacterium]
MAQQFEESPAVCARVAAHLIVGPREEPFLGALCESLEGVCDLLIVNDNSPDPSPHAQTLAQSAFAKSGRMILDRTPFSNFAVARNICLRLHAEHDAGEWIAFIDADEVHGPTVRRIAVNLHLVPPEVDFVDGYTLHFFQSFDWFMSIDRRLSFFRYKPDIRWERSVHEQLAGLSGARVALPYLYAHYGWVVPAHQHALKGRQYLSLGAPGRVVEEEHIPSLEPETYFEFEQRWATAMRFRGEHPPAARATIERIRSERAKEFAQIDELVARHQTPVVRLRNAFRRLNYEQRWRARALNPLARLLLA